MSKATTIQKIKDNVYENVNNEVTGQMAQDAMIEIVNDTYTELDKKQDKLISGTNIKTVQGQSLLGSGNVALSAGSLNAYTKPETDALLNTKVNKTTKINDKPLSGDITLTASDVSALPNTTNYAASPSVAGPATSANKVNSTLTVQQNGTSAGTFNGSANTTVNITPSGIGTYTKTEIDTSLAAKQVTLVSGTNIKTVNNTTLLGSGNIAVQPTLVSGTNIKTINGTSVLGNGDITVGAGINVIDNLTSTSTGDALSANQGKILNDKITATNTRKSLTIADFTNLPSGVNVLLGYMNVIKMNNLVTVNFTFDLNNNPLNLNPNFRLENLPYSANEIYYGTAIGGQSIATNDEVIHLTVYKNSNYIFFEPWGIDSNATILYIKGSITYLTND